MLKTFDVYFALTKDGKLNSWSPTPCPGFLPGKLVLKLPEKIAKQCNECFIVYGVEWLECTKCGCKGFTWVEG
jgi:hypothetical protein